MSANWVCHKHYKEEIKSRAKDFWYLTNILELFPRISNPLASCSVNPLFNFTQARLHILSIAERAAFSPQQQLVEQVDIHTTEKLLEEFPDQEGRNTGCLKITQKIIKCVQNCYPMLTQLLCSKSYKKALTLIQNPLWLSDLSMYRTWYFVYCSLTIFLVSWKYCFLTGPNIIMQNSQRTSILGLNRISEICKVCFFPISVGSWQFLMFLKSISKLK